MNLGAYPNEYDKKNYAIKYFKNILSGWRSTRVYWEIEFTNIIIILKNHKNVKCKQMK